MTSLEEETIPVTLMLKYLKNTELIYESLIYSHAFRIGSVFASLAKHCVTFLTFPTITSLLRDSLALDITHISCHCILSPKPDADLMDARYHA